MLVASSDYLSGKKEIRSPKDLSEHECLGYKNFEHHVWHLSQQDRFESVDIQCRLTANEATTLLHAALKGAGISFQPAYLATSLY